MRFCVLSLVMLLSFVCSTVPVSIGSQLHSVTVSSEGTIRYSTWLHTDGKYIKNESNQTVFLRGAAFGGLETFTYWQGGYDFLVYRMSQYMVLGNGKANVIRCPITPFPHEVDPEDKWPNEPAIFDIAVDQLVDLAVANDIYVVIEFHGGLSRSECERIGQDPTDWINWWLHWVNRYKNVSNVCGFEIYNEPWDVNFGGGNNTLGRERWHNIVAQCYQAIKTANPKALVFVASASPFNFIDEYFLENPLGPNVVYTWDTYYKDWSYNYIPRCYDEGNFSLGLERMTDYLYRVCRIGKAAMEYNLPVLGSEFGWSGTETNNWEVQMADELNLLNEWETNWYVWWWWAHPANYGLVMNNYTALSPQGEIWAEYLGHTPIT